jgi:hypothetical protein
LLSPKPEPAISSVFKLREDLKQISQKLYGSTQKSSITNSIVAQNYFKITPKSKFNITKPGHAKKASSLTDQGSKNNAAGLELEIPYSDSKVMIMDTLHQTEQTPQNAMIAEARPAARTSIDYNYKLKRKATIKDTDS